MFAEEQATAATRAGALQRFALSVVRGVAARVLSSCRNMGVRVQDSWILSYERDRECGPVITFYSTVLNFKRGVV